MPKSPLAALATKSASVPALNVREAPVVTAPTSIVFVIDPDSEPSPFKPDPVTVFCQPEPA
jgi:hypothetical protein